MFTKLVAELIDFVYSEGYELTFGDAYRSDAVHYGHPRSLHRSRLAIDLNLFKEGVYLTDTSDHLPFGEFWEALHPDCRWGGRFEDGNHYSITHGGMS